jgi:sulfur carrier protein
MIQVTVNGTLHRFESSLDVVSLLRNLKLSGKKIAVERNGAIVPRGLHPSTVVEDGDRLEIIVAVGGG